MPGQVNNNLQAAKVSQKNNQVFGITLDNQAISSLQQSINSLASQLSSPSSSDTNQNSTATTVNQNQTTVSTNTNTTITTPNSNTLGFTIDPTTGEIIFIGDGGSGGNSGGAIEVDTNTNQARSRIADFQTDRTLHDTNRSNRRPTVSDEPVSTIPSIQVPFFERQAVDSNATLADGTTIETLKNDDGTIAAQKPELKRIASKMIN
jgi:hypothetical protein